MKRSISIVLCCLTVFLFSSTVFAQKSAEDFFKLSQERLMKRDLDGALAALNQAIVLKPALAWLYARRGKLHLLKGQIDEALTDLDQALLLDSELKETYATRASLRMMKGDPKGALNDLDNAIARGDESSRNYSMRAQAKLMLMDAPGAMTDYNTAISMNPGRVGTYLGRASARKRAGDESGALADYKYVIDAFEQKERDGSAPDKATREMRANDIVSPLISGPEKSKPGDSKGTTKTETVVTVNPEAEMAMSAEEMEYLPNVAGAYMNRSQIFSERGEFDAALTDLNKSVAIFPHSAAYELRGKLWQKRGDLPAALADFNKSISLQPQMALAYLERGKTLLLMGKDEEAEKDFKRCLELNPRLETMVTNARAAAKTQSLEKP